MWFYMLLFYILLDDYISAFDLKKLNIFKINKMVSKNGKDKM